MLSLKIEVWIQAPFEAMFVVVFKASSVPSAAYSDEGGGATRGSTAMVICSLLGQAIAGIPLTAQ